MRGGDRAHGAAVEAAFEGQELLVPMRLPSERRRPAWARASLSAASQASVPELQKEDAVEAGEFGEAEGEFGGVFVEEEVAEVWSRAWLWRAMAAVMAGWL